MSASTSALVASVRKRVWSIRWARDCTPVSFHCGLTEWPTSPAPVPKASTVTRTFRTLAFAGILLTCTAVLSGCVGWLTNFVVPNPSPTHESSSAEPEGSGLGADVVPQVGDCWVASFADMWNWAAWYGDAPVDCSKEHQAYTYAVVTLEGEFPNSWQIPGEDDAVRPEILRAEGTQCGVEADKFLGELDWNEGRVNYYVFVPSLERWKAGDRTVRCDVAYFAYGSEWAASEIGNLPSDIGVFVEAVKSDPDQFRECLNVPGGATDSGPLTTDGAVWADCRNSPDWALTDHGTIDAGEEAPYPGKDSLQTQVEQICNVHSLPSGQGYASYFPNADSWATGDRSVYCWTTSATTSS
jgi:Septum formation